MLIPSVQLKDWYDKYMHIIIIIICFLYLYSLSCSCVSYKVFLQKLGTIYVIGNMLHDIQFIA